MKITKQKLVNRIFQDIALVLGGAVAVHRNEISDELIWNITNDLKRLHSEYIQKTGNNNLEINTKPHPAIVALIKEIKIAQKLG